MKENWDASPISLERMMTELSQTMDPRTIIVDESVTSRGALQSAVNFDEPDSLYGIRGGAPGLGNARLHRRQGRQARPARGGGGRGRSVPLHHQALWTAARYDIPVTWVVCNNRSYKILKVNLEIYLRDMLKDQERQSEYMAWTSICP